MTDQVAQMIETIKAHLRRSERVYGEREFSPAVLEAVFKVPCAEFFPPEQQRYVLFQ